MSSKKKNLEDGWPEPGDLGASLPPVLSFRESMLPEVYRGALVDFAERFQVPFDYVVACALAYTSGVSQRRFFIQPKSLDYQSRIVPTVWGVLIGDSASGKSPPMTGLLDLVTKVEDGWQDALDQEQERFGMPPAEGDGDEAHLAPRIILNDATYLGAHKFLQSNPAGGLLLRDELRGWFAALDVKAKAFFLEVANGDGHYAVDRATRSPRIVRGASMVVFGGMTPETLRACLRDETKGSSLASDGLPQRLLCSVWPDPPSTSLPFIDRVPQHFLRLEEMFERVAKMDARKPRVYLFDDAGQDFYIEWRAAWQKRLANSDLEPAERAHLTKYFRFMPLLAGIFCVAENAERINQTHARQSSECLNVFRSHARRIYSPLVSPFMQLMRRQAESLKRGTLGPDGWFTCRDLQRRLSGENDPGAVARKILREWEAENIVRRGPTPAKRQAGRPKDYYLVNPRYRVKK